MPIMGLVVDDDPQIRSLLADFLRRRGMEVLEAKSGNEALALTQSVRPAFVVTDLEMADGDGLELCRRLRGSVATAKIHIVVVSGDAASQARRQLRRAATWSWRSPVRRWSFCGRSNNCSPSRRDDDFSVRGRRGARLSPMATAIRVREVPPLCPRSCVCIPRHSGESRPT